MGGNLFYGFLLSTGKTVANVCEMCALRWVFSSFPRFTGAAGGNLFLKSTGFGKFMVLRWVFTREIKI